MSNIREVKEGLQPQGITEAWRYTFDTSPVDGTAEGTPTLVAYEERGPQESGWPDVTADVVSGSCSLDGTDFVSALVQDLRLNRVYRLVARWSVGNSQYRTRYWRLVGQL